MHIVKKTLRNIFLGVIACIVVYWILHEGERASSIFNTIGNVLSPFVVGAGLAFVLNVPMRAFENLLKGVKNAQLRRVLAILMSFICVVLILTLVFVLLIPQLIDTIQSVIPKAVDFAMRAEVFITDLINENQDLWQWVGQNADLKQFNWSGLVEQAMSVLKSSIQSVLVGAFNAIGSVGSAIFDAFIGIGKAPTTLIPKSIQRTIAE